VTEAIRWLRKAAGRGFAPAQFDLGKLYEDGVDGTPDYVEAAYWYRRAAEQPSSSWSGFSPADAAAHSNDEGSGDQELAAAQTRLGLLLFQGRGVPLDYAEASKWFHQAADKGNLFSQSFLGGMYVDGLGVPQDFAKAAKLFRAAAENGFALAQYHLGELLEDGRGLPQDYQEAARWFRLAAEQGHDDARFRLARAFSMGNGLPQSDIESARWTAIAAENGHAASQKMLGLMYGRGQGVPQSHKLAYVWSQIAFANGDNEARSARDAAATQMSPAELDAAEKQAKEWQQRAIG
jgi:TPR repeat protein